LNHVDHHRAAMKKKPKKISRNPEVKKVSVKEAKPKLISGKTSDLKGGFVTISETRIRKIYR
jgi:hypothetical protein